MRFKEVLLLLLISLIFSYPFFQKGYFATHDGEWAIVRLTEMSREIRDLQIPPRWSDYLNHGYGYPIFLFTYPLPYYLGEIIHFTGVSFTDTLKSLFVISVIISALGMYYFSRRYWGKFGGLISSILYISVPYRLVDLYIRGSIGESLSLAIIPWLFWAIDKYLFKEHKESLLVAILFASLILSHNASALLYGFLIAFYLAIYILKNSKDVFRISLPFIQGLLISCYFWLPAVIEKKIIYLGSYPLAKREDYFASIFELLNYKTNIGIKPPLFIGYIHLITLILAIFVYFTVKNKKIKNMLLFSLLSIFIGIFFLFPLSNFIWNFPGLSSIDFPWRMLVVISFLLSFVGGSVILLFKGKWIGLVLLVGALFLYLPLVKVENRFTRNDSYYETNDATTTSSDELMPLWVVVKPKDRPEEKVVSKQNKIKNLSYNSKMIEFTSDSDKPENIIINTIYFPGWKFRIDQKEEKISISQDTGLMTIDVPSGSHQVQGRFTRTPIRIVADILSILGLGSIGLTVVKFIKLRLS